MPSQDPNAASGCLPDCIVIGPQKAGNSWIDEYLRTRDDVGVSRGVTELFYFDRHYHRGQQWYAGHFAKAAAGKRIVEVAPTYFHSPVATQRIAADLGRVRIVCTLRHPAKRAFSLYLHLRRYGLPDIPFREAVAREPIILETSRYATHLQRWIDAFGQDRVLVLPMDILASDANDYVRKLCNHLDIPFFEVDPSLHKPVNAGALPPSRHLARAGLRIGDTLRSLGMYGLIETGKRWGVKTVFFGDSRRSTLPKISDADLVWFMAELEPEIEQLERTLGADLSHWKNTPVAPNATRVA